MAKRKYTIDTDIRISIQYDVEVEEAADLAELAEHLGGTWTETLLAQEGDTALGAYSVETLGVQVTAIDDEPIQFGPENWEWQAVG